MKAIVNKELCIGCGACSAICPAVFELDENYVSKVILESLDDKNKSCAEEAAVSCPVGAITVE